MDRIRYLYVLPAFVVLAVVVADRCSIAHARPTHGEIVPLPAGSHLGTPAYFPHHLGRTWTSRDSLGSRYRRVVAASATPIDKDRERHHWLRRREIYQIRPQSTLKLIERWIFELDPQRGVVSIGGEDQARLTGAIHLPGGEIELPRKLATGAWSSTRPGASNCRTRSSISSSRSLAANPHLP